MISPYPGASVVGINGKVSRGKQHDMVKMLVDWALGDLGPLFISAVSLWASDSYRCFPISEMGLMVLSFSCFIVYED